MTAHTRRLVRIMHFLGTVRKNEGLVGQKKYGGEMGIESVNNGTIESVALANRRREVFRDKVKTVVFLLILKDHPSKYGLDRFNG